MTRRSDLPAYDSRVHAYAACGRHAEAEKLFQRPISVATDVGVLAPEYDSNARRQLGDFRQAFYHLALISSAFKLYGALKPVEKCRRNGARATRCTAGGEADSGAERASPPQRFARL